MILTFIFSDASNFCIDDPTLKLEVEALKENKDESRLQITIALIVAGTSLWEPLQANMA